MVTYFVGISIKVFHLRQSSLLRFRHVTHNMSAFVLKTAVRMESDIVLIQEPKNEKERDSTRTHPSFTFIKGAEQDPAKCWIVVNRASRCRVTELKDLTRDYGNYVQVIEVTPPRRPTIVIANVFD
jgi:hypothetical protein